MQGVSTSLCEGTYVTLHIENRSSGRGLQLKQTVSYITRNRHTQRESHTDTSPHRERVTLILEGLGLQYNTRRREVINLFFPLNIF